MKLAKDLSEETIWRQLEKILRDMERDKAFLPQDIRDAISRLDSIRGQTR